MANQSKKLICQECSKEFTARQNLSRHKKKFHSVATFQINCSSCDHTFTRKEHLVRHLQSCKGKNHLKCKVCGTEFNKSSNFKRHLEICGRNKNHPCSYCPRILRSKKNKEKHEKTCTGKVKKVKKGSSINYDCSSYELDATTTREVDIIMLSGLLGKRYQSKFPSMAFDNDPMNDASDQLGCSFSTQSSMVDDNVAANQTELTEYTLSSQSSMVDDNVAVNQPTEATDDQPLSRQTRRRYAKQITKIAKSWNLPKNQLMEVLSLSLKQLNLSKNFISNYSGCGRVGTELNVRQAVWKFWHDNSTASTLTTRLAKLRISKKPKLHTGLQFVDTVNVVTQRNIRFYENNWYITTRTNQELYKQYIIENPTMPVSSGTFFNLKPFYVRGATKSDFEMCCCKLHLHARWAISALLKLCMKAEISLPEFINSYETFLAHLSEDCAIDANTYISWECTPDKNSICEHISFKWDNFKTFFQTFKTELTVPLQHFETIEHVNKSGNISKHLTAVTTSADINFLMTFIDGLLPKIVHHRNLLKNYRKIMESFNDFFDNVVIDVDFSENLSVPVKYEPQSLHWHHEQVTVHSGICKVNGEKTYHAHISDDKKHDQTFVDVVLSDILQEICTNKNIIIHSDNCKSQYKSAQHFNGMQRLANELNHTVIRIFGVANHGKGEVDHVGGLAKVAIRLAVSQGHSFYCAAEMVEYLTDKFKHKESPKHYYKEIHSKDLEVKRIEARFTAFQTILGCDSFQVVIFSPNSTTIKASNRLCLCEQCQNDYGTCSLFTNYTPVVQQLNKVSLRSSREEAVLPDNETESVLTDLLTEDVIIAVAADTKSIDSIWFIQFKQKLSSDIPATDDYGHIIPPGVNFFCGHFLERESCSTHATLFKISKKKTYFYKESVLYPFVEVETTKRGIQITNVELSNINLYLEDNGFSSV